MNDQLEYTYIYIFTYIGVLRIRDQYLLYRFAHFPVIIVFWSFCICVLFTLINLKRGREDVCRHCGPVRQECMMGNVRQKRVFSPFWLFMSPGSFFFQLCHCLFCLLEDFAHCKDIQKNCLHS